MTNIDFVVGFILIIGVVSFIIYFVTNAFSNEFNAFNVNELKESASSLERQLFDIKDDKSLISTIREIQTVLTEINGTDHTEKIEISIEPSVNKVHVYDVFMNEIPSTVSQISGKIVVSFWMSLTANEKKRVNIFYFGDSVKNINYLSSGNKITVRILSDKELNIVSQEKCSKLKNRAYDETKKIFGFQHQFQINLDGCSYGIESPLTANIIVKSVSVLFEMPNELIYNKLVQLKVW
jgi:hypothetical protein